MLAKRLAVLVVQVLVLVSSALAQDAMTFKSTPVNQLSVTVGRTFVSTQTIRPEDIPLHFGNPTSLGFNYGRLFKTTHSIFGLYAEVPVGVFFKMDLNTPQNLIPKNIGAVFVTPSARLNIFANDSVTPWVSAGGGYGRFWQSSDKNFFGPNTGPSSTNTGVVQFGGGLDVWFWRNWGARGEFRD